MVLTFSEPAHGASRRRQELPTVRRGVKPFASLPLSGDLSQSRSVLTVAGLLILTITLIDPSGLVLCCRGLIAEIPDDRPLVRSVTCGHPPPLLLRANDVVPLEAGYPAPPLGLGALTQSTYHLDTFSLHATGMLLLYTDGALEARNADGAFYPLAKRLSPHNYRHPAALLDRLRNDLLNHVGGRLGDDAALIAIERHPVGIHHTSEPSVGGQTGWPPYAPLAAGSWTPVARERQQMR
ncbi:PP2C family protein-serine/threonine phosphatase [Streptomyces sp900105755]|uniref:PP2C family protein-serine/threonine phosphatase n=1 Tax=Streptomyces sp. 900105755 TaxID=3154389 RepID=A0ABV1TWG8_9ACTN